LINADDLDFVADLARSRAGLMLRGEKVFFIQSRLGGLARRESLPSVQALVQRLRTTPDESLATAVVEALAAPETCFFRDKAPFDRLADEILPDLAAVRAGGEVSIWCAGCSTGQEAYSLAMAADRARTRAPNLSLSILGTDISEKALEKARAGLYTQFEVQRGLPIRMLIQHFERVDDNWRAGPRLRQSINWARLNLMDDFSRLGRFDVVLCRNVLSYLDPEPRRRIVEGLASVLAADGALLLGEGESADLPEAFEPARGGAGLHRRNPAYRRAAA
jgi:chemotaxis protein methyltransferase CheR